MRILVVNVNTSDSVTEAIRAQADEVASAGTEIMAVTPFFGPPSVEGHFESYLSAVAVMDRVRAVEEPVDAVVHAGYGEEGLAEMLEVPVADITESSAHLASQVGHRYSVVTTLDRAVPQIRDRLSLAGLTQRCASVRSTGLAVLELEHDADLAVRRISEEAATAVREDGAEVVCLGCAGMAGLRERVAEAAGVPVVDSVAAAVGLAETLVRLGLRTSKVGAFAPPRDEPVIGWPITPG